MLECRGEAVTDRDALKTALRRSFRYTAAVSMQSVLFGSGGHTTRPPGGQLAGFQRCTGVLSQQMRCLGSSYWLHDAASFLPKRTQQCTLRCARHAHAAGRMQHIAHSTAGHHTHATPIQRAPWPMVSSNVGARGPPAFGGEMAGIPAAAAGGPRPGSRLLELPAASV